MTGTSILGANRSARAGRVALSVWLAVLGVATAIAEARGAAARQPLEPARVVEAYIRAINNGDAVGAATMFADHAVWVRAPAGGPCSRQSPCVGRTEILAGIQATAMPQRWCLTPVDQTITGNVVNGRWEIRSDNDRAIGIERVVFAVLMWVSDGEIVAQYVIHDLSDAQTALNAEIRAGRHPPGPPIPNPAVPCGETAAGD